MNTLQDKLMIGTQRNKQNQQLFYPGKTKNIQELEISSSLEDIVKVGKSLGWQYKLIKSYQKKAS